MKRKKKDLKKEKKNILKGLKNVSHPEANELKYFSVVDTRQQPVSTLNHQSNSEGMIPRKPVSGNIYPCGCR